mgnify:CR=1 FL=1
MKKTLLLLAALTLSPALYAQDYHVVLWDNATAPTSNGLTGEELQPKPGQWSNTQKAEMWIYKAGDNATGQALVFFPGGGYSTLSVGNGHKEAKWFAENGVTAAVVKYRLPNGHSEVPRNDADEALRVMREMAAELNIDPAKVGVSGTSAGGYLAGSVGTLSEVKPDFMILYYPVISADADKRHKGTFVQLHGADDADKPVAQEFSLEKKVDARTPPTLLFHCDDDKVVPAVNSALLYQKLKEHGVKADVIIGAKTREVPLLRRLAESHARLALDAVTQLQKHEKPRRKAGLFVCGLLRMPAAGQHPAATPTGDAAERRYFWRKITSQCSPVMYSTMLSTSSSEFERW